MTTSRRYFKIAADAHMDELGYGIVSNQVRFKFDHPIHVLASQIIELNNGQLFLLNRENDEEKRTPIHGKWDR